jgi:hypothetical protein
MIGGDIPSGDRLAAILSAIAQAEEQARLHDRVAAGSDWHAEAAQRADEGAESERRRARALIESAFPGVSWSMIERAAL